MDTVGKAQDEPEIQKNCISLGCDMPDDDCGDERYDCYIPDKECEDKDCAEGAAFYDTLENMQSPDFPEDETARMLVEKNEDTRKRLIHEVEKLLGTSCPITDMRSYSIPELIKRRNDLIYKPFPHTDKNTRDRVKNILKNIR